MDPPASSTNLGSDKNDQETSYDSRSRGEFSLWGFLSKFWGLPGIVICGQLLLQGAAWGFFGAIWLRGLISIPSFGLPPAVWFKPVAWLCTQISTGLAGLSSLLFSLAVRQSITLYLNGEGMTFATFLSSVQISSASIILDTKKIKWTMLSIVVFALANAQTSGWNTLLTPGIFNHDTEATGRELDLASPILQTLFSAGALDTCVLDSPRLVALSVGQSASGYAALNGDLGFPESVSLLDQPFNTSTAGILPLNFYETNVSSWFPNTTTIPATLSAPTVGFRHGLSWTSSMNQQGFTADVRCNFANLEPDAPSVSVNITNGTDSFVPSHVQIRSNCAVPNGSDPRFPINSIDTYTYSGNNQGSLFMMACGGSAQSYTLIFVGFGLYDFMNTTVCSFTPKITNVRADYSYEFSNGTMLSDNVNTTTLPGGIPDLNGPAGMSAVTTMYNMVAFSQGLDSNIVGDQLTSVLNDVDGPNFFLDNDIMAATEEYIRGVAEYSGTVVRACLSARSGIFVEGLPQNVSISSTGNLHTEFFGWEFTGSTSWVLIPGAFIAFATIYIMLATEISHAGDRKDQSFDPADTLDLVSASAAGGLSGVFAGTKEDHIREAEGVSVVLAYINGRGPALQRRAA
ncbi:hypothetical protein B0H13DRAFT_2016354 [Mycena leptocephala]|nr:hypothetical protein B0H13DRAFT_2016354 [Mycena leptocephala]